MTWDKDWTKTFCIVSAQFSKSFRSGDMQVRHLGRCEGTLLPLFEVTFVCLKFRDKEAKAKCPGQIQMEFSEAVFLSLGVKGEGHQKSEGH